MSAPNVASLRRQMTEMRDKIERRELVILELQEQVRALEESLKLAQRYIDENRTHDLLQPAWKAGAP